MFLVLAKYKENIEWANIIKNKIIYSKIKNEPNFVDEPYGEASSYLKYIIDNYDKLNEWTMFAHAHEKHWHHSHSIFKSLSIDTDELYKNNILFLNINHWENNALMINIYPNDRHNYLHPFEWTNEEYNYTLRKLFNLNVNANYQVFPACAQFIVHKSRILNLPLDLYKRLYDWHLNDELSIRKRDCKYQQTVGPFFFECIWHFILGENLIYNPPIINNKQLLYYTDIPFKNYSIFYKINKLLIINKLRNYLYLLKINKKIIII